MKVQLSAYEHAMNVLSDAPVHVDVAVCAAFIELQTRLDRAIEHATEMESLYYREMARVATLEKKLAERSLDADAFRAYWGLTEEDT